MPKKSFLDSIEVESPCSQSWSEMRGSEQIRFCDHCAKDVHNLSNFTGKQARKLVLQSNGAICVKYVRRPDGRIETLKKQLHQITRQSGLAAGVLGTSLSFSAIAHAQTSNTESPNKSDSQVLNIHQLGYFDPIDKGKSIGTISGTVTDPNGAVVPFAVVTATNEQATFFQIASANQDGFYEFKDVSEGIYRLKIEAAGFQIGEIAQFPVAAGGSETRNVQLNVQTVQAEVVIGGENGDTQTFTTVGIIALDITARNALVVAVENNDIENVKARIYMGARVNGKDKSYDGNSALHVAVENGYLEIAEVLLNSGAKINSKNREKRTPLMMLDEDATPELVNLLLRHGAKINLFDKQGNTALINAAAYAGKAVVQALIGAGANIDAVNRQGETALMTAAENGETETVQLLLGSGANPNARNRDGKTALNLAKNEEAGRYLIAYGAMR